MTINWERWESLGAAFLAVAEMISPILKPEPINMPVPADSAIVQFVASPKIHDNPNAKLTMLYRENLLETARTNAVTDTYQSVAYKANTPIGGPPRRREYHTDKFVFTWDPPLNA